MHDFFSARNTKVATYLYKRSPSEPNAISALPFLLIRTPPERRRFPTAHRLGEGHSAIKKT